MTIRTCLIVAVFCLCLPLIAGPQKKAKTAPKPLPYAKSEFVGVWRLQADGKWDGMTVFKIMPDGSFFFMGSTWKSNGVFKADPKQIELTWTAIDGTKVKPGTMKKSLNLTEEHTLVIDSHIYAKDKPKK